MRKLVTLEDLPVVPSTIVKEVATHIGKTVVWTVCGYVVVTFGLGFIDGFMTKARELANKE